MQNMSLEQIAGAVKGTYCGNESVKHKNIKGVAIDSRKIEDEFLFIPIKGARVDGHNFISQVMKRNALCTLSEHALENVDYPYILVESCEQALKDLARYYRSTLDIKVIGITGSVGKTSTKEMVASILERKYNVLKTSGNFNNEIGLPLTIFNIREHHEIAVLEMGISEFGEMHRLADIAKPDIAIITNIGLAHMENLGSREGILQAKTEMFDHLNPNATIVLNGDDDMLSTVSEVNHQKPVFFGLEEHCDVFATDLQDLGLDGTGCKIHFFDASFSVTVPTPGRHMVYNALAGAYVGRILGLNLDEIREGIASYIPISGRTNIIRNGTLTIIDDCYNANPISMKASLDVLTYGSGRTVAILGDMFELGPKEKELHYEVGCYAANKSIGRIYCIGDLSKETYRGANEHLTQDTLVFHFATKKDFLAQLPNLIAKDDTLLVKASNGMKFPEIVESLKTLNF
ncbi:UDP-N-acetylmuramoyl-tripeptide--D-alanyl-D-alanine ligase [Lachnospiraceae bacterium OttesenSCG-928-E19]|nr:UDP-N-acetylmuramoyl-tripeptide--D-alanyl-D-alanine ligase [Lachnospiraceae bacterium OttesenSCG-928-E19]